MRYAVRMTPTDNPHGHHPADSHPPGTPAVSGKTAGRLGAAFYTTVAAIALAGQSLAARDWLGWPLPLAVVAVSALELGGIALAARADFRRRLGERAIAARTLSAAVAVFAVVFNWAGHGNHLAGGFFAGMSALGYAVWLINSGDRRRDQLRATGRLAAAPPEYEMWQWLRHPLITRRARALAKANPTLGLYPSLVAAAEQVRQEKRTAAISKALRRKLSAAVDPVTASIAVHTYDLDAIADRLAGAADYDGMAALLAADLTPQRLTAATDTTPARRWWPHRKVTPDSIAVSGRPAITNTPDTTMAAGLSDGDRVDDDRTVVPITRRRRTTGQVVRVTADSVEPTIEELAATLLAVHGRRPIGRPAAAQILRRVHGACSNERAKAAKSLHNSRLIERAVDSDDPEEGVA